MEQEKLTALDLTLIVGCKLNCHYCPQNILIENYFKDNPKRQRMLKFDDFKIILDKVERGSTIGFVGLAEVFLNPACADMIVYADKMGYKISLYTTLVGMTMEDLEKIRGIQFDRLVLHIPDAEYNSKFDVTNEYVEILRRFHQYFPIDFYSCHGSVHPAIIDIIDKEKYSKLEPQNRAGNLDMEEFERFDWKGKISCYRVWSAAAWSVSFMPELLPDGTVLYCCQDYGLKHQLGNLINQSWKEICNGKEYKRVIDGFSDDTVDTLCRQCGCASPIDKLPTMQLKQAILKYKESIHKEKLNYHQQIVAELATAETVCVFGLGKLFREHFYQEYWDEALGVTIFSDNDVNWQGQSIKGIPCVEPTSLTGYQNLVVILFIRNDCNAITQQLKRIGVDHILRIEQVLDACNTLKGR